MVGLAATFRFAEAAGAIATQVVRNTTASTLEWRAVNFESHLMEVAGLVVAYIPRPWVDSVQVFAKVALPEISRPTRSLVEV